MGIIFILVRGNNFILIRGSNYCNYSNSFPFFCLWLNTNFHKLHMNYS